jgi:hypothetical protein
MKRVAPSILAARLTPTAAQGIGMVLHELATNAAKYGALSNSEGRVRVSWKVAAVQESTFTMQWLEEGGPTVAAPSHNGYGQIVIGSMVEAAVDCTAEIDYRQSGLSWKLSAPVAGAMEGRCPSISSSTRASLLSRTARRWRTTSKLCSSTPASKSPAWLENSKRRLR